MYAIRSYYAFSKPFDAADGGSGIADNHVFHSDSPLSSYLSALFGQCFTHSGSPVITSYSIHYTKLYEKKQGSVDKLAMRWINTLIKIVVWVGALLLFLDNLPGVQITTLVAGLGIGGIAIAFAAQAILEDVFSFVTIFFDRPFEIDDYIFVDNLSGTVEHIGIKTTRVRSISGEQLIFSNKDLTNSRVRKFKRMHRITSYNVCYTKLLRERLKMRAVKLCLIYLINDLF